MVTDVTCFCPCRGSLEELNISWCRGVPEPWLGVLADACTNLRKLTVFGCSQVCSASALLSSQGAARHAHLRGLLRIRLAFALKLFKRRICRREECLGRTLIWKMWFAALDLRLERCSAGV